MTLASLPEGITFGQELLGTIGLLLIVAACWVAAVGWDRVGDRRRKDARREQRRVQERARRLLDENYKDWTR